MLKDRSSVDSTFDSEMLLEAAFVSSVRGTKSESRISSLKLATHPVNRNYSINLRQLFDENYALASTQSLKNKDIPEGGAKGTILPALGASPRLCFEKYVDVSLSLILSYAL